MFSLRNCRENRQKLNITEADRLFDQINYDSAYFFYKKAIALCDPIDDYADDYVYSQLSIANLHQNTNNYTACEEASFGKY